MELTSYAAKKKSDLQGRACHTPACHLGRSSPPSSTPHNEIGYCLHSKQSASSLVTDSHRSQACMWLCLSPSFHMMLGLAVLDVGLQQLLDRFGSIAPMLLVDVKADMCIVC